MVCGKKKGHLMRSDLPNIILQLRMDFLAEEAWARRVEAFFKGQKIPRISLGEKIFNVK